MDREEETEQIDVTRFPTFLCGITLALTMGTFALAIWASHTFNSVESSWRGESRIRTLHGVILRFDEVLTMSVRMAVATGDGQWEQRYRSFLPQLAAAIAEAKSIAPGATSAAAIATTRAASAQLETMENNAFALVNAGRLTAAQGVLSSSEYQAQVILYARGINGLLADQQKHLDALVARAKQRLAMALLASLTLALLSVWTWIMIIRRLAGMRSELEYRIQQRTAELSDANVELLAARDAAEWTAQISEQSLAMVSMAGRIALMGAWAVDLPSLAVRWSDEVRRLHEVPVDFVPVIETAMEFYAPEYRAAISEAFGACMHQGTPFDLELQVITANARRIWVRATGEAVRDSAGVITRVQGAFQDVSDRVEKQRELARTNRALQMLSKCSEAVVRAENEQHLLEQVCQIAASDGGYRMAWVGYARNDEAKTIEPVAYAGVEEGFLTDVTFTWLENDARGLTPAGQAIRSGKVALLPDFAQDPTYPFTEAAEKRGYRGVVGLPLCDGIRAFGYLGLYSADVRDIGDDEIQLLKTLAENLAFGILNFRSRFERERIERAVTKVAASVSAITGTEFFTQLALNMAEATGAQAGFVARLLPGDPVRARTITAVIDGETVENFEYVLEGTPCERLVDREEWLVPSQVADHFPRSLSLRALKAQAYVGRRLVASDGSPVGLIFVLFREPLDSSAFISSTMRIFAARAGAELERQEAGQRILEQASLLDKATDAIYVRDLHRHVTYWNQSAERLYGWSSREALGKSARELHHLEEDSADQHFDRVLDVGEWSGEFEEVTIDGRRVTVEARWTLVRDEDGRPKSILSIETDITERKALEAQYLRAQRMESVGTLAGGMAHDLNNLLAPVMTGVGFLQRLEVRPDVLTVLKNMEQSVKRGSDLVQQVLSFGRGVEGARVSVPLDPLVREVESIAESVFPKNITFERDIARDLWEPVGDATQIAQVLLNLCVNARDAMAEGGRLRVAARNLSVDEQTTGMHKTVAPGRYVLLEVTDEGRGMTREVLNRAFEPFFTTKELGKGSGLGLSTVAAIVKSHGGVVTAQSEVGKGSMFKVYLNVTTADIVAEPIPSKVTAAPGKGQLVLAVDDEVAILNVIRLTMEASGYRVMVAENGVQAIALYAVHRDEIALVITDMMMPLMDGHALIAALYRINPEVKIIAASGLYTKADIARAGSAGVEHFLTKPYSANRMLEMVGTILSEERDALVH